MTTLAIDIGGTKIAAAVCDENDSIIQRWRVPTPMDADAINQHIAEVYREAVAAGHTDIEAIGISAAGNVSADRKTLTFSANDAEGTLVPLTKLEITSRAPLDQPEPTPEPTVPAGGGTDEAPSTETEQ